MKIEGGYLSAFHSKLVPFQTGTVSPALGVGALSGLASTEYKNLKKGSGVCRIETDGEGLYLGPASSKGFETEDNGLYLMKQGGLYDGRELILGPNSPLKNIPILGMILGYYFQKKILYTLKMEIDETDGNDGHISSSKKLMKYMKY